VHLIVSSRSFYRRSQSESVLNSGIKSVIKTEQYEYGPYVPLDFITSFLNKSAKSPNFDYAAMAECSCLSPEFPRPVPWGYIYYPTLFIPYNKKLVINDLGSDL
jgi:hypothetical protein